MRAVCARSWSFAAAFALALSAQSGSAVTLFSEDFDGYTSFPVQYPSGDYVNPGLPNMAEGADETWYGARFEGLLGGTPLSIDSDLAVQRFGDSFDGTGPGNQTPVGRFEDDAGLILQVSTVSFTSAMLEFDWRTFSTSTSDLVRVGYFASATPIPFTLYSGSHYLDARTGPYAWSNWTELMVDGQQGTFEHESFSLPTGVAYLYVALWMDDGEGDFGKLDNVVVTALPEPTTGLLLALGLAGVAARRRRAA
ncbi:MAG TPA: PEP-CTERM sorting domain-containing protein [Myxococcota bacterium]|nr:PEP-CTERM sorting domain-containing protein [Myxococcota bacterium]